VKFNCRATARNTFNRKFSIVLILADQPISKCNPQVELLLGRALANPRHCQ